MDYEIEVTGKGVVVRYLASPSVEGIAAAAEAMAGHPDFRASLPTVWDLSHAPNVSLSSDDMRRLAPLVASIRREGGRPRVAIVTSRNASFAGARMFSGINELRMNAELGVFRTFDEAAAWAFDGAGPGPDGSDS